jgi:hypothetical protein
MSRACLWSVQHNNLAQPLGLSVSDDAGGFLPGVTLERLDTGDRLFDAPAYAGFEAYRKSDIGRLRPLERKESRATRDHPIQRQPWWRVPGALRSECSWSGNDRKPRAIQTGSSNEIALDSNCASNRVSDARHISSRHALIRDAPPTSPTILAEAGGDAEYHRI